MAAAATKVPRYDPVEILELQITISTIQNEALMRYLSDPGNLPHMRSILKTAFLAMGELVRSETYQCPSGTMHNRCRCEVPVLSEIRYLNQEDPATS